MVVLPVHPVTPVCHLLDELLTAGGCLLAVPDSQGDLLHIALDLALLCLFQELVGILFPCHSFFPFCPLKGLSLFRNMQALFPALRIAPLL